MAKIKLHNPELAANSKFSNLVIESLTTDPTLVGTTAVGRLWFNNTDKTFKGAFLDEAGTATDIKPIGIDNSAEVAANTSAINVNTTDIATNTTDIANIQNDAGTLADDIATNATNIASNVTDIATNATNIASNVTDIATNATNIASNVTNIASNVTDIATNATDITAIETDLATNYLNKTSATAQVVTAETTFSSNLVIDGNLTVSGTTSTIDTETLLISDNILTLNNGVTGAPTENAGLEVDRGDEGVATIIQWNETLDQVEVLENGSLEKVATVTYVDAEATRATGVEANLQTELDATQTAAGLNEDGSFESDATTTYLTTATSIKDVNNKLDAQIKTNTDGLAQEVTDRGTADTALDTRISDLETAVGSNIGDLSTLTTDANDTLVNAINEVDSHADINASDLATEITNRANADTNIQAELDSTQTGAGLATDGAYNADTLTNYLTSSTDLMNADKLLDGQIKTTNDNVSAVDTRVTNLETAVTGNIGDLTTLTTDEKDTLVGAINEVDSHIDEEVTNRTTADTTLQTNISNEETSRTNADTALDTRIDNVNTAAGITGDSYTADTNTNYLASATDLMNADKVLDTTIKTNLDNLAATTATNGTNLIGYEGYTEADTNIVNPTIETVAGDLKTTIDTIASLVNTKIHDIENRYVKGEVADADKSDTYTLAHNLDTEFVDVSVQVYDTEESVWRFDLVVIEVIDVNVVKISLASGSAEQIRYVIQGY